VSRDTRFANRVATIDRLPLARAALAAAITLAGVHKLVAPAPWDAMVVQSWADTLLPVSTRTWTLANAVGELLVGLLLFTTRYTAPLAAFVFLSLSGTLCYIALAAVTGANVGIGTELLVIIAIHDIGLAGLAARVTLDALTRDS